MKRREFIGNLSAGVLLPLIPSNKVSGMDEVQTPSPSKGGRGEVQNPTPLERGRDEVNNQEFIKPKALQPGDTVGIIAPGTAVSDPDDIAKVKEALDYLGLKFKFGKNVINGTGYKTRTVKERIDDIHDMFRDDSIKAVFAIRGGYGSQQLLDKIDYQLIRKNPKIFLGYSDITALHLAINKYSRLVTFHGPVMLSAFTNFTVDNFKKALFQTSPIGKLTNLAFKTGIRSIYPLRIIKPGKASGQLIVGNLSLISNTMGTPYEIDTKGKILVTEDVGEKPFRIDRMLTQLRLAGKLEQAAGIIFGNCSNCDSGDSQGSTWDKTLGEVLDDCFANLKIPVLYGLLVGHTNEQLTLPLGVQAELDADGGVLDILEGGVV